MAKFLSSVGFGQASGSVAGTTYSRNRYGSYMRNRAMPTNPSTAKQSVVRARLGNLAQQWRALTAGQRTAWITQAATTTLVDSLGQQYSPSGPQFFTGLNSNRVALGLAIATTPPAEGTQAVITAASATAVGASGVVTVTFAPAIAAGSFYELQATAPVSAGRSFFGRSQFKTLGYLASTDNSPYVATAPYAAVFGTLGAGNAGQKVAFRLVPFGPQGFRGTPVEFVSVIS